MKQKKTNKNKLKVAYKMVDNISEEEIERRLHRLFKLLFDLTRKYIQDNNK